MIDFLLKSTVSLFVLLFVYHLALEKEKMHAFNRFFLLFSLLFSFLIPFLTIEVIQELGNSGASQNAIKAEGTILGMAENTTNYWFITIWVLYGLITIILLIRFTINILKFNSKRKSNTTIDYKNAKLVLLKEATLPYTFMKTIFINENDYYNRTIEDELYTHEMIHVNQRHTLDVLLIEILKVVFWFNPIFIFYKKAIQLNHEFLADEKVVKSYNNVPFYQNLLITKANANPTYYLASNLNYLVTKKRLIMMTKNKSTSRVMLKKTLLIPILYGIIFSLCTKTVAQEQKNETVSNPKTQTIGIEKYFENTTFKIQDEKGKTVAEKKYGELSSEEKKNIPPPPPPIARKKQSTNKEVDNVTGPKEVELSMYKNNVEKQPTFPGGIELFYKFIAENYKISEEGLKNKIKGKVFISFMVETDGSLTNFKILKDIDYGTGDEAIRVLSLSPKWEPAKIDGKPVRVMYSLPINLVSE